MFDPYVLQYRALEGIDGQQLLRSGELRHVESDARLKSPRIVTLVNSDYYDMWCTKKVDNGFVLEGKPIIKLYVDAVIGT